MDFSLTHKPTWIYDPDSGGPYITVDHTVFCPRHFEPFRANWPTGAHQAVAGIVNAVMHHPEVISTHGGDVALLSTTLNNLKPLCCLVGEPTTRLVVGMALSGSTYGEGAHGELWTP